MISIWSMDCTIPEREKLKQNLSVDTAVIGAGMVGILCAYFLQKQGQNVIVLEGNRIGSGVTQNTTAKITAQHRLFYDKLIKEFGKEKAGQYAAANMDAIDVFKKIIKDNNIDCNLEEKSAYVYSLNKTKNIENEVVAAKDLGIEAFYTDETGLPFKVSAAVEFKNQAQFHPLKFIKAISESLMIYEKTFVKTIEDNIIITEDAKVSAKNIIVTTHYPFLNTPGYYFMRMHQERSYVLALQNAGQVKGMYIDEDDKGYSFRNYGDLLLLGGAGHRTGENPMGGAYVNLREKASCLYPNYKEVCCWSTQDCVSLDEIPYIGHYSKSTPNLYVATGFKKWGMTSSMVSAMLLSDMICEKTNDYAEVFKPERFNIVAVSKNLVIDGAKSVSGLVSQIISLPDKVITELKNGYGGIVDLNGEKIGAYKDDEGNVFTVSTKCTHLGCQLQWNPDEKSWDCPCHGSRFNYTGKLINNPAMEGIK